MGRPGESFELDIFDKRTILLELAMYIECDVSKCTGHGYEFDALRLQYFSVWLPSFLENNPS